MTPKTIAELENRIHTLIEQADAPFFTSLDEIEAAITLMASRLTDAKRPILQLDAALLGKLMDCLEDSFIKYRHTTETPEIP